MRSLRIASTFFTLVLVVTGFHAMADTAPEDLSPVTNVAVRTSTNAAYHNASITVSWTGTSDAIQYSVRASQVGTSSAPFVTVGSESKQAVIDGLVGGATYVVQVRVIGSGHVSPWTSNTLTATPLSLPMAPPQPPTPTADIGAATVVWTGLSGDQDGGSPVTGYRVTEILGNTTILVGPTDSTVTMRGLTEGASASFTVAAVTAVAPQGIASLATIPITILTSKADASPSGASAKDAATQGSSGNSGGGGFAGGGGGPAPVPSVSSTPTPTPTPTPSITAIPLPSLTAKPDLPPLPSATPLVEPTQVNPTQVFTAAKNPFFTLASSKSKPSATVALTKTKQTLSLTSGKSVALTVPSVPKGTNVKATVKLPNGQTITLLSTKTTKTGTLAIPTLGFTKAGSYSVTLQVGKVTKVITIAVTPTITPTPKPTASTKKTAAPTKTPIPTKSATTSKTTTITCTNGKSSKSISGVSPICPSGYWRK